MPHGRLGALSHQACSLGQIASQIEPLGPLRLGLACPLGVWCHVSWNGLQVDTNQELHRPLLPSQHRGWEADPQGLLISRKNITGPFSFQPVEFCG